MNGVVDSPDVLGDASCAVAQRPQDLLGQVSGLVAGLPERPCPGRRARRRGREHEY
jgi:hypothetical protein